jgi:hypothetical protein
MISKIGYSYFFLIEFYFNKVKKNYGTHRMDGTYDFFPHPLNPLSHKWARGNSEPAGIAPFSHSWEKGKGMRVIFGLSFPRPKTPKVDRLESQFERGRILLQGKNPFLRIDKKRVCYKRMNVLAARLPSGEIPLGEAD